MENSALWFGCYSLLLLCLALLNLTVKTLPHEPRIASDCSNHPEQPILF